jgi:rhodanese-related sulfurtransferase
MNKILITLFLVFFTVFQCDAKVLNFTPDELLAAQKQGTVIIDIRTPEEWQQTGTIPNAKRIMFFDEKRRPQINQFMAEFKKWVKSKEQPFVLVCRSGSRTGKVTTFLDQQLGYKNAAHLEHGMKLWLKENRKVEKK